MQKHTLKRTGLLPLSFTGELLAESDGQYTNGQDNKRWHNIQTYRTAKGNYVLYIEYNTHWPGEIGRYYASHFTDALELSNALEAYDPCEGVLGFPPGEHYAEKQARLIADIEGRFGVQVSDILEECNFTEEVE